MVPTPNPSPLPHWTVLLAVGLFAGATLGLQVAFTRHFSFLYWHHFAFMIIGIGMLGFAAAGAWLARGGGVEKGPRGHRIAPWGGLGAALGAAFYLWLGPSIGFEPLRLLEERAQFLNLFLLYGLVLVTFTALGLAQGSIIAAHRDHAHRIYGADLLGAGLGCLLTLALLSVVSATTALLLLGATATLGSCLLLGVRSFRAGSRERLSAAACWLGLALALALAAGGFGDGRAFAPAPSKGMSVALRAGPGVIDYTTSSATLRIDVTRPHRAAFGFGGDVSWPEPASIPLLTTRTVYQDAAAPTALYRLLDPEQADFLGRTNQGLAYQIRQEPRVCVIGAGGGPDLLIALHHGARSITAVELNPRMLALGRDRYREFVGGLFQREEVHPVAAEGRHFLARGSERFDIIQMSGVDTFAALASGAYAMSENYLYTVEAGQAVLRRLEPDGLFTNSRWFLEPPRETLRLVHVLVEALRREGAEDPAQHMFAIRGRHWGTTLLSKRPFTETELSTLRSWADEMAFQVVLDPNGSGMDPFVQLVHGTADSTRAFLREYPYELAATTDDRPFFFQFYRWRNLIRPAESRGGHVITGVPVGYAVLAASLLQMALLSTVFILGPLWSQRSQLQDAPQRLRRLGFFGAIGIGFMGVEITSLQMFTVFLGAPVYSMAITLAALLVATGLGSLWAGRTKASPERLVRLAVLAIVAWVIVTVVGLPAALGATIGLPLWLRGLLVAGWLLPVGLALGVPMPTAVRALRAETPALVPWAWGANACASVLASLGVVLISMQIGFAGTLVATAAVYVAGYVTWRPTVAEAR